MSRLLSELIREGTEYPQARYKLFGPAEELVSPHMDLVEEDRYEEALKKGCACAMGGAAIQAGWTPEEVFAGMRGAPDTHWGDSCPREWVSILELGSEDSVTMRVTHWNDTGRFTRDQIADLLVKQGLDREVPLKSEV